MFKVLSFWTSRFLIAYNGMEGNSIYYHYFGDLWQPLETFENSENIGTTYNSFLSSLKHPASKLWNLSLTERMKAVRYTGDFIFTTRNGPQGTWFSFKYTVELPMLEGTKYRVYFSDITYLGAIFGLSFGQFVELALLHHDLGTGDGIIPDGILNLLKMWQGYPSLVPDNPAIYEISNLSISFVNAHAPDSNFLSFSNVDGSTLREHLSKLFWADPIKSFLEDEEEMAQNVKRIFAQAQLYSLFLEKGLDSTLERLRMENAAITQSDDVWLVDAFRPKAGTISAVVQLYSSFFVPKAWPPREPTSTASHFNLVSSVPTGCRGVPCQLHRIFTKSAKIRRTLLFNPIGIPIGRNCIFECISEHLKEVGGTFSVPTVEEFWGNPTIFEHGIETLDLANKPLLAKINEVIKFNIICFMERLDGTNGNTIIDAEWPLYDKNSQIPPLRLLCNSSGLDVFGFPMWHAVIVSGFGLLKDKIRCKVCGEWFGKKSNHFKLCTQCENCGKCYNQNGNHYLSCKRKTFLKAAKDQEESLTLAPSHINHKEWMLYKNVWFCDFECFQNSNGTHVPYLIIIKSISQQNAHIFWGSACLEHFTAFITSGTVKGYLYCHNGSGYDFNFILVGLLQHSDVFQKKPANVLMRGNKILSCQISSKPPLTLRDTYLLLPSSLAKLCRDLKVKQEFSKTSFDHSKIRDFKSADRHREEVTRYCLQDVKALEEIFRKFSRAMWEVAPVLLQSSMSLASHALELWKKIEAGPVLNSLVIPTLPIYKLLREMYHGGRVLATVPKYDSELFDYVTEENEAGDFTFFDEDGLSLVDFTEIKSTSAGFKKETLRQVDVVSLYPHVMEAQRFPVGKFIPMKLYLHPNDQAAVAKNMSVCIKSGKYARIEHDGEIISAENPGYSLLKQEMFRHCYKVDMDCPDIIVAFLMRKENDSPIQNLAPLRDHWVTGVELFEAVKIGYTLLAVKASFGWDQLDFVFKKYIGLLFKIKEDNKKDKTSIMYLVAKLLMNALSGKFGQKIVLKITKLLSELPDDPDLTFEKFQNIHTQLIEAIDDQTRKMPVGYIFTGEKKTEDLEASLPTHLSVFILAHSRRKMSKMLRKVNGYTDPKNTLMYTDTDSMVVTESTFKKLEGFGFIGSKLGQLEDEFPKDLIVSARFLAPKVYCLCLLRQYPGSDKAAIAYKIRCKGIPHRGDVFFARDYKLDEREFNVKVQEVNDAISNEIKDLGKKFYVLREKSTDQVTMVLPFINISICDLILSEKFYLQVHFGSILKSTKVKFSLISKWMSRCLGLNSWWNNPSCPRILKDAQGYQITGCKGLILEEPTPVEEAILVIPPPPPKNEEDSDGDTEDADVADGGPDTESEDDEYVPPDEE